MTSAHYLLSDLYVSDDIKACTAHASDNGNGSSSGDDAANGSDTSDSGETDVDSLNSVNDDDDVMLSTNVDNGVSELTTDSDDSVRIFQSLKMCCY